MSLFIDPTDMNLHGPRLAQLLLVGGVQLETLARGQEKVAFKAWAAAVQADAKKRGLALEEGQLDWLWDALLSEPKVRRALRSRVVSRDEEWKDQDPMQVLSAGKVLGVFLKPFRAYGGPVLGPPDNFPAQATITLKGDLWMVPGKAVSRRFECRDVACMVEIEVSDVGAREQEAVLLKVDVEKVEVEGKTVTVQAKSLNHSYTLTSRRLEPQRRVYGGAGV